VEGSAGVSEIRCDGDDIWWAEQRPSEGGRCQLVRRSREGTRHDLFAPFDGSSSSKGRNWNARTAVMEYGGGAWAVRGGVVVFAEWSDQRLYRAIDGAEPQAITPRPSLDRGWRWSEPTWLDDEWLVCVRESHEPEVTAARGEAANELVAVPVDGSAVEDPTLIRVLVSGPDFVQSPAVRGDRLVWLCWDHPAMPWDGTRLMSVRLSRGPDGVPLVVEAQALLAGGQSESVVQPGFTAAGDLVFCTDRTGWWNPWKLPAAAVEAADGARAVPLLADGGARGEIGGPLWVGGLRWWAEVGDGSLMVSLTVDGSDSLAQIDAAGRIRVLDTPFTEIGQVVTGARDHSVVLVAGSPISEVAPYLVEVSARAETELGDPRAGEAGDSASTVSLDLLRPHRPLHLDSSWISEPRHVSFPTDDGATAHGLYYPPTNPGVRGPADEFPPLVVMIHGGPTSAARLRLDLSRQFWTSRGFAVLDVNHRGSTGYGRPYRDLLSGRWGVVDVADAVAGARSLAAAGEVDGDRMAIRGGSAGGFTTLAALTFHDAFAAGASHYGVADLAALAGDTHKFESRYLDGLVGPWPEARSTYDARSPIHHTDGIDVPLLVLQGSEDEVVPPAQAQVIVDAVARKGVPHAYILFEGEQHGFRRAENIVRALEAELWFYGRVFGFEPADRLEPVPDAVGL